MARRTNPELVADNISCHCLRYSKAMHLPQSGVNLVYIRDYLGHYAVETTEVYAKQLPGRSVKHWKRRM